MRYTNICQEAVGQNPVPLVNIKIAGKWMFIPLKMVSIGIDPYPYWFPLIQIFSKVWMVPGGGGCLAELLDMEWWSALPLPQCHSVAIEVGDRYLVAATGSEDCGKWLEGWNTMELCGFERGDLEAMQPVRTKGSSDFVFWQQLGKRKVGFRIASLLHFQIHSTEAFILSWTPTQAPGSEATEGRAIFSFFFASFK